VSWARPGEKPERRDEIQPPMRGANPIHQRAGQHLIGEGLDRQGVVGRLDDAEAGDNGADQLVVHQRLAAGHEAGDAGLDEPRLESLPDPVRAVQHAVLAPVEPGRRPIAQQVGHHPAGLGGLIGEGMSHDAVRRVAGGLEPLLEQSRIPGDQLPRGVEDLAGAAAIEVQDDRLGDAEIVAEPAQDGGVGTGPGKDGLLVVAHGETVAVERGELGDHLVLGEAQVLELVHQHVVPSVAHLGAHVG
jgi:hypothetical protein